MDNTITIAFTTIINNVKHSDCFVVIINIVVVVTHINLACTVNFHTHHSSTALLSQ